MRKISGISLIIDVPMAEKSTSFHGDKKKGHSALYVQEEWLKARLLPLVPRRVETYHLTLTTILWALLVPVFSLFARKNPLWMFGVSAMVVAQYVTDLLDGAIGRLRDTGLVKWGFYMDHLLDFLFLCSMLVGYALILPQGARTEIFILISLFATFMVTSFLSFAATQEFQIAYCGIGPTEMRLVFIAVNTAIAFLGPGWMIPVLPYLIAASAFALFFTVYRTQRDLWNRDMRAKAGRDGGPAERAATKPNALRQIFLSAATTGVAGALTAWFALSPKGRIAALVLLSVSAAFCLAGLVILRARHHERMFIRQSIRAYAPYVLVAAVVLAGLRAWLILSPPAPTPLASMGPEEQAKCLASDIQSLYAREKEDSLLLQALRDALVATNRRERLLRAWPPISKALDGYDRNIRFYEGFNHLDVVSQPRLHSLAFATGFLAYLQRLDLLCGVADALADADDSTLAFLDAIPSPSETCSKLLISLASDRTALRLHAGCAYYRLQRDAMGDAALAAAIDRHLETAAVRHGESILREIRNPLRALRRYAIQ